MRSVKFFTTMINVMPGEGRILVILLFHSFFLGVTNVFFYSAASALFLVKFDVEALPYAYICSAFVLPVMGLLFFKLQDKLPTARVFGVTLGFMLVSICIFRFVLFISDLKWPVMALFIWAHVLYVLGNLVFWGLAGRCLDVRQSKRLFGLIGVGEVLATIVAGFAIPGMVEIIGAPNLLMGSAVGVGLCLVVLTYAIHLFPERLEGKDPSEYEEEKAAVNIFRGWRKNRYRTLMAGLWALSTIGMLFVDFAFFQQADTRYSDADQLAKFFGVLLAIVGVFTLLSRMFVFGKLLNRYGLTAGLLALPTILILGSGSIVMGHFTAGAGVVFWLVIMIRIFDEVARVSIEEPSKRVLYQPLPIGKRLSLQTLMESLVEPIAAGLAGLVLLILTHWLDFKTIHAAFILICLGATLIIVALELGKEYQKTLLNALSKRTLADVKVSLSDASSLEVLMGGLKSQRPEVIIYCLNMLQEAEHPNLENFFIDLLDHPLSQIRLEMIQRVEQLKMHSVLEAIRERVEKEEIAEVKGAALRVMCGLDENISYESVAKYMAEPDSEIRRGVVVGLYKNGGIGGKNMARSCLMDSINSSQVKDRIFAAQALGEIESEHFHELLLQLMNDEDSEVLEVALATGGKLKDPRLWPRILECLISSKTRRAAFSALVAGGESSLPFLEKSFQANVKDYEMDLQLVRLFGQIGGGKAINILADNVSFPNEEVRHQILLSLAMINYQAPKSKKGEILANIQTEIKNAVWMLAALVNIPEEDQSDLLKRALNYSLFKSRERVLWLLSFIYGSKDVLRAKAALVWGRSEQRSYAIEALGNIISNELREIIFPLIEDFPPGKILEKLDAFFPQNKLSHWDRIGMMISRPLDSVSPWIKSCALYLAGQSEDFVETDAIIKCLSSPIPLIRETAVWALHSLDPTLLQKRATQLKNDNHPVINHICDTIGDNIKMLLTIEKVIILKKIGIFSEVPDKLLVNVASNLKEIELMPGEMIIKKGTIGSSMFIIIDGEVKVHDEDRTLATLSSGEVFGELALLDPEPRSASVTALLETTLLKIEREMLFELLAAHSDVAGGIIKVLCRRVRNATGENIGS